MSEVKVNIPRAHAWTFVCDSPPKALVRRSTAVARGERRTGPVPWAKKSTNATISSRFACDSDTKREEAEIMGLCSSSNKDVVAEKENAGDCQGTTAGSSSQTANSGGTGDAGLSPSGDPTPKDAKTAPKEGSIGKLDIALEGKKGETDMEVVEEPALLDSTALLTPDPVEDGLSGDAPGVTEAGGAGGLGEVAIHGDVDQEGLEEKGDRFSWMVKKLKELGSSRAVDVAQLDQVPEVEDCLYELLSDRERHLKAMENLTMALRRREAEAEKAAHDLKALTMRLECTEQDKSALDKRFREGAEVHRTDRARWFVLKQELETRCAQLQGRDLQYRAAIRKKEIDFSRLQEVVKRTLQKGGSRSGIGGSIASSKQQIRGIEANFELSPAEDGKGGKTATIGGIVNEQARRRVEGLEKENAILRNMLVDLQAEVSVIKEYHDKHGDLVSAGRGIDGGVWGGEMDPEPLPEEVIEGMPAGWLKKYLGEETARQIEGMRGAVMRVLSDSPEAADAKMLSQMDEAELVSQLREARSLLREQDAILLAALFNKPGEEGALAANRQRCACGGESSCFGESELWETREQLDKDREDLASERSKLERDRARFLEEAIARDRKDFAFVPPTSSESAPNSDGSREGGQLQAGDSSLASPGYHRHLRSSGTLMVTDSPLSGRGDFNDFTRLTFTPPKASPNTARLLENIGIDVEGPA